MARFNDALHPRSHGKFAKKGSGLVGGLTRPMKQPGKLGRMGDVKVTERPKVPSTRPGHPHWPAGVPEVKDVAVHNSEDGKRLAEAHGVARKVLDKYAAHEPTVTPQLQKLAAAHGGHMEGLQYRLKTHESLTGKLYNKGHAKGLKPAEYGKHIGDALRYTMIGSHENLAEATNKTLDHFRSQGYKVELSNTFHDPNASYKGINVNLSKGGHTFEVQFHTPHSFQVKMKQHDLYEIARSPKYSAKERAAAEAKMLKNAQSVRVPHNIHTVR